MGGDARHEEVGKSVDFPTSLKPGTLLVRRRPPSEAGQPFRYALPVECPVAQLCRKRGGAGRSCQHNYVPGTSRWGAFSACPGAVTAKATVTVAALAAAL